MALSGIVNLSGRSAILGARESASGVTLTNAADFRPDVECVRPGSPVLRGSDVIAAEVEQVVDPIVG